MIRNSTTRWAPKIRGRWGWPSGPCARGEAPETSDLGAPGPGPAEEAAQSAITLLRLARHYDREQSSSAIWWRCLPWDRPRRRPSRLASRPGSRCRPGPALDAELARHDVTASFVRVLKSERAYGLLAFQDLNLGGYWPARGLWNNAVVYYLDVMNEQIGLLESRPQRARSVMRACPDPPRPGSC